MENEKQLDETLDKFNEEIPENKQLEVNIQERVIKQDKSILERVNKKIILEDGRQLLY